MAGVGGIFSAQFPDADRAGGKLQRRKSTSFHIPATSTIFRRAVEDAARAADDGCLVYRWTSGDPGDDDGGTTSS